MNHVGEHRKVLPYSCATPTCQFPKACHHQFASTAARSLFGTVRNMTTNQGPDVEPMNPTWVRIDRLDLTSPLRPVDPEHVALLVEVLDLCPPLLAHRDTGRVLDGHHRAAAASALGRSVVPVHWVDRDEPELLEVALKANTAHGLPLTSAQRRDGTDRLLGLRPDWSNRRIADAAGVSEATVRRWRQAATATSPTRPPASTSHLDGRREGRDNKTYPSEAIDLTDLLRSHPASSNRSIARLAGCSPSTVAAHRRRNRLALEARSTSSERPRVWTHARRRMLAAWLRLMGARFRPRPRGWREG